MIVLLQLILIMAVSNLKDFVREVEDTAQCAVCLEIIRPPVKLCMKGHAICSVPCGSQLRQCPYCRGSFSQVPSKVLDHILKMMPKACRYSESGCQEICFKSSDHEVFCWFRTISCTIGEAKSPCSWRGTFKEWVNHVKSTHPNYTAYVAAGENDLRLNNFVALESRKYAHFFGSAVALLLHAFVEDCTLHITLDQISLNKAISHVVAYDISFGDGKDVIYKYRLKARLIDLVERTGKQIYCMHVPINELKDLCENGSLPVNISILKLSYTNK